MDDPFGWAVNNHPGAPQRPPVPMSPGGRGERGRGGVGGVDTYDTDFGWASRDHLVGQERQRGGSGAAAGRQRGGSGGDAGRATEETGTGRNGRRWTIFRYASALGSIAGDDVGGEETPGRLHSFAFPSGTRKEEVKKNNIKHEGIRINQQRQHRIVCYFRSSSTAAAATAATAMATNRRSQG